MGDNYMGHHYVGRFTLVQGGGLASTSHRGRTLGWPDVDRCFVVVDVDRGGPTWADVDRCLVVADVDRGGPTWTDVDRTG